MNRTPSGQAGQEAEMVTVKLEGYQEAIEIWGQKPARKAAVSTLKKVVASARSTASDEIRNVYNVKKSDLDPRLVVQPPRADDLTAVITISGKGMSLSYFGARQFVVNKVITRTKAGLKTTTRKRSAKFQGVEVEVEKGKRTQLRSAFMATMKSGHIGVLRRKGSKRLPITEKSVVSVVSMVLNAHVAPAVLQKVQESWDKVFPHELEYQLSKGTKS